MSKKTKVTTGAVILGLSLFTLNPTVLAKVEDPSKLLDVNKAEAKLSDLFNPKLPKNPIDIDDPEDPNPDDPGLDDPEEPLDPEPEPEPEPQPEPEPEPEPQPEPQPEPEPEPEPQPEPQPEPEPEPEPQPEPQPEPEPEPEPQPEPKPEPKPQPTPKPEPKTPEKELVVNNPDATNDVAPTTTVDGGKLPDTATPFPLIGLIGAGLATVGALLGRKKSE